MHCDASKNWPLSPSPKLQFVIACIIIVWCFCRPYSWYVPFASATRRPYWPNLDWHHIASVSLRHPFVRYFLHHTFLLVSFYRTTTTWLCMYYKCTLCLFRLAVHRHRYWLWYTTQRFVCGGVRKVYQKLKQFKVQFLVLQRRTDPSQVMLQCLPSNKVSNCSSICALIVLFNRMAYYVDQFLCSLWVALSLTILCKYSLGMNSEMLNASSPGGQQGAVFVRALWRASAFRSVWPAGRRAVLRRLWEGLRCQHRSEVLFQGSILNKHFFPFSLPAKVLWSAVA